MSNKYEIEVIENRRTIIYEFDCEGRISYELSILKNMSDEEVCKEYNVDYRHEAITLIKEYWRQII